MNIFVLNSDPVLAAIDMCDKHVVKMIIESAQLLCTAHNTQYSPYRRTHPKHPCSIWTASTFDNYFWLLSHGFALCDEYSNRYKKIHKSYDVLLWCRDNTPSHFINGACGMTEFAQAMPDQYKHKNAVIAYRQYYLGEKARFARWKTGNIPAWFQQKNPMLGIELAV